MWKTWFQKVQDFSETMNRVLLLRFKHGLYQRDLPVVSFINFFQETWNDCTKCISIFGFKNSVLNFERCKSEFSWSSSYHTLKKITGVQHARALDSCKNVWKSQNSKSVSELCFEESFVFSSKESNLRKTWFHSFKRPTCACLCTGVSSANGSGSGLTSPQNLRRLKQMKSRCFENMSHYSWIAKLSVCAMEKTTTHEKTPKLLGRKTRENWSNI